MKKTNLFTSEAVPEQATETIYAWNLLDYRYDDRPVTVKGTTYSGLPELLRAKEGTPTSQENNLLESVIVRWYHPQDMYGRFVYGIAVRCHPLHYAILRMMPTYLISHGNLRRRHAPAAGGDAERDTTASYRPGLCEGCGGEAPPADFKYYP